MEIILLWEIIIGCCILLSAFFSGAETALVSARPISLETQARNGRAGAKRALFILEHIEDAMGMILVGNNLANISATAFIAYVATKSYMADDQTMMMVTAIQTVVFLILCEITPKVVAKAKAETFLVAFSLPIRGLLILLKPITRISLLFTSILKRLFNIQETRQAFVHSRDELDRLFKIGEAEGVIDEEHQIYVSEILSFRDLTANEVMTPTIDIISINRNSSVKQLVGLIESTYFSRIPVFESRVDNIIGYVFYRDILKKKDEKSLDNLLHRAVYVPATKKIFELHREMQQKKTPMVFVVNEYGAVIGVVTHEDIAEEVVGEIQTRDHAEEELIHRISDREFVVQGDLDIEHFQKVFPVKIEKRGFETIGGFVTWKLGRFPKRGEHFIHDRFTFTVEESTDRSVEKVRLKGAGKVKVKQ